MMDQSTTIFYRSILTDKVKIEPKYMSKGFRDHILQKLKKNVEGVCSKHGYVKEDSIDIYKMSAGNVDLIGLNGYVVFEVSYYADICNPLIGNILKANVLNVNKFGILADVMGILEIIVPKNSINIVHDSDIDIDAVKIGDQILIEIMGKKYELYDKKISIVGRLVSNSNPFTKTRSRKVDQPEETLDLVDNIDGEGNEDIGDGDDVASDHDEDSDDSDSVVSSASSSQAEDAMSSVADEDGTNFFDSSDDDDNESIDNGDDQSGGGDQSDNDLYSSECGDDY